MTGRTILLIGPPGAGKTTIAGQLAQVTGVAVIATGQQLRTEIRAQSALGQRIEPLLEQGQLAPDSVMAELMRNWLQRIPIDQDCLLDGYPRSVAQAHMLETILADLDRRVDAVIVLTLDEASIVHRLSGRRICRRDDGQDIILHIDDTAKIAQCLARGVTLVQREDDHPDVIRTRLRLYEQETAPVLAYYTGRVHVHYVNADQPTPAIVNLIRDII